MRNKDNPMLVNFEHLDLELQWAACLEALEKEYTLSAKKICKILKCSRSWFNRYLKPHLHYIFLSNGAGRSKINYVKIAAKRLDRNMAETNWYSYQEFNSLIIDNITQVTRRTILIPLEMLIREEERSKFAQEYSVIKDKLLDLESEIFITKKIEKEISSCREEIDRIMMEYASAFGIKVLNDLPSETKRTDTEDIPYDLDLEILDLKKLEAVHDIKDYGDIDEKIYRDLFSKGYIKLLLQIPDEDGCISTKVYYLNPEDHFNIENLTGESILIKYKYYKEMEEES